MRKYKIIPQLRENCVIQDKSEFLTDFEIGNTTYIISNIPTKKFSIISRIDGIEHSEEPQIFVDKRILGEFGENDEVFVLKYNPAEALDVSICVSEDYTLIGKGDWTANIKPSLLNKLVDIGKELPFLINWEAGAPIVATGYVSSTLPNPPVYIGDRTRIYVEKNTENELSAIKRDNLAKQKDRVDILEKQIEKNVIELLKDVKQSNYPSKGQKYQFTATNPRPLFKSILRILKGLDYVEEPTEQVFDEILQDYLASVVILYKTDEDSQQLIDIQIIASKYTGTLIIWVTGKDEKLVVKTLDNLDARIVELKQGLEQKIEILSLQCPECGASLPIQNIDINGVVECIHCNKVFKIPKSLRY